MATYLWPGDTGWPTAEGEEPDDDVADLAGEIDLDALCLHAPPPHLWDDLTVLERRVVRARFGMDGDLVRSLHELHAEGVDRRQLREALDSALAKLRARLTA